MKKGRVITNDILVRAAKADMLISNWMREKSLSDTDPEDCISLLVEQGIYSYDSKGKAHHFREDLRTLRDCERINVFKQIKIEQKMPGSRWFISLVTN